MLIKIQTLTYFFLLIAINYSEASPVNYDFSGTAFAVQGNQLVDIERLSTISGSFIYDVEAPITSTLPLVRNDYASAVVDLRFEMETVGGLISVLVGNDGVTFAGIDANPHGAWPWGYFGGTPNNVILPNSGLSLTQVSLAITTDQILDGSLPTNISQFADAQLFVNFGARDRVVYSLSFFTKSGNIPSTVPEPVPLALLGFGLLGLGIARKHRS